MTLNFNHTENTTQLVPPNYFDMLAHHHIFDSRNILPKTMFQSETELFRITLIKDKIYQLYKTHLQHSNLINNTNERLKNKDFIDENADINQDQILTGLVYTIGDFAKWLTRFAKEIPGFSKINLGDFSTMISASVLFMFAVINQRFYQNNELCGIISNNVQMTKKRLEQIFGVYLSGLLIEFHARFEKLDLSENELAIFYAFVLISCNSKLN